MSVQTEQTTEVKKEENQVTPPAETVTPTAEAQASQASTPDQSQESNKPKEEVKPEESALGQAADTVEEYELARSEDSKLSDEDFDAFVKEAEEKGYSKDIAEAILKAKEADAAKYSDEKWTNKGLEDLKKSTHEQLLKDEMFNTEEKLKAAIEDAGLVFAHFGDADLKEAFKNPIIGSNPSLFKFILKIAKVMKAEGVEADLTTGNSRTMDLSGKTSKNFLDEYYKDM